MPKRPDVGVIAEQLFERLKQIEDQVTHSRRLVDELGRLRDVVKDLEREIVSRVSGEQVTAAEPSSKPAGKPLPSGRTLRRVQAWPNARPHRAARTRPGSARR
jgi:hypothetical protein